METTRRTPKKEIVFIKENGVMKFLIPQPDSNSFLKLGNESGIIKKFTPDMPAEAINGYLAVTPPDEDFIEDVIRIVSEHFGYPAKMIPTKMFNILVGPAM